MLHNACCIAWRAQWARGPVGLCPTCAVCVCAGSSTEKVEETNAQQSRGDTQGPSEADGGHGASGETAATSAEPNVVKLSKINTYTDEETSRGHLHNSDAAKSLQLGADDFTSVSLKILERKLELVQWEFYDILKHGEDKVLVDIKAKKDSLLRVELPLHNITDVSLPFAGTIAMASPSKALHFCSLFGLRFCIQPRTDPLTSDILIPAWAAKPVTKAAESYFNKHTMTLPLLILREKDTDGNLVKLADMKFVLLPPASSDDAESRKLREKINRMEEDCVAAGGCKCCLACQTSQGCHG